MNRMDSMLRERKSAIGMTDSQLATEVGCSRQHLYDLRRGKRPMTFREAHEIARILGISLDKLFLIAPEQH